MDAHLFNLPVLATICRNFLAVFIFWTQLSGGYRFLGPFTSTNMQRGGR